jgi:hypothetical protein
MTIMDLLDDGSKLMTAPIMMTGAGRFPHAPDDGSWFDLALIS